MGEQIGYITDKASGKDTKRPQLRECLEYLRKGDTLHVHSMDRMGRNLMDLQGMVEALTREKITIVFHKEGLTFSGGNNAMQKLMMQVMGRKTSLSDAQKLEIRKGKRNGMNPTELVKEYGVSRGTIPLRRMGIR